MPRAFITGITGQDGSYLAELLIEKGYEVHGLVWSAEANVQHPARNAAILHIGDLLNRESLKRSLHEAAPDEIYHLAAQTHVGLSFEQVESTCQITAMGTLTLLELARQLPHPPRFYHASSSEVFGKPDTAPQDEQTPFRPVTPYGGAKAFATQMVAIYRRTFGLFASNGICYNHESPRRGPNFVTQKICRAAAAIKQGRQQELVLGATTAQRDWGDARDYVRAMWLALQQPVPDDFIFATGQLHSVQQVVELAFAAVDLDWRQYVRQDPKLLRPEDPSRLVGNPSKAARVLGWKPEHSFKQLITEMTLAALSNPPG